MTAQSNRPPFDRRDLLRKTVLGAGAMAMSARAASAAAQSPAQAPGTPHVLPPLPYKDDALAASTTASTTRRTSTTSTGC